MKVARLVSLALLLSCLSILSACSVINEAFAKEAPSIEVFEATSEEQELPFEILFSWKIVDVDSPQVNCTLNYGDGETLNIDNCSQVTDAFHSFEEAGSYVVELSVTDGHTPVSASVPVVVRDAESEESQN